MIEKELCPTRQVENDFRWRRMQACEVDEWSLEERAFWQGKEKRDSQGKDPRTYSGNSQEATRRKGGQKKRKEEKWRKKKKKKKKKVKYRRRRWWKNVQREHRMHVYDEEVRG